MAAKRRAPVRKTRRQTLSKELLRAFFDQSPDIIFIIDKTGRYVEVNSHGCEILGYTRKEMLSRSISDIVPAEDLERDPVEFKEMQNGGTVLKRRRMRKKDGTFVYAELTTRMLSSGNFIGIARDLTNHALTESSLQEREAQLASIFRAAPVGIGMVVNRVIQEANQALCQMTGYSRDELIGQSAHMLYPSDEEYEFVGREKYQQIGEHGTGTVETRWKRKDGSILHIILSSTPLHPEDLSRGVTFTALDITSRKRAEDALREKEAELDRYFTNTLDLLCIADTDGYFRRLNKEWETTLGYPINELQGRRFLDLVHPDDLDATLQTIAQLDAQKQVLNFTNRYRCRDGSYRWIEWRSFPSGKLIYAAARDTTAQREAEESLRYERQLLRTLVDSISDLVYAKDKECRKTLANAADVRAMGAQSEAEVLGKDDFAFYSKELADEFFAEDQFVLRTGQPVINKEEHVLDEQGEKRYFLTVKQPLRDTAGNIVGLVGVGRDITERKRMEEELREKEAFRRTVFENSRLPIVVMDAATSQFIDCNPAAVKIYGFASRAETLGKTPLDVSAPVQYDGTPSREKSGFHIARALAEGSIVFEWRHMRPDGAMWDAEVHLVSFLSGQRRLFQFTLQDITERKRAELALREGEEQLRLTLNAANVVAWDGTPDGTFHVMGPVDKLFGTPKGFVHGSLADLQESIHPDDRERVAREIQRALSGEKEYHVEHRVLHSDESIHWIEAQGTLLRDEEGKPRRLLGIARDVTERKRAEDVLRENMRRLQTVVTGAPIVLYSFDRNGVFTLSEGKGLVGLGIKPGEIVGRTIFEVYGDQPAAIAALRRALAGETFTAELSFPAGGTFEASHTAMRDNAGNYAGTIGILVDITERKRAEEALRKSEEKYLKAFNSSPDSISLSDIDTGELLEVNAGFERVFGHKRDDILGKSTRDLGLYANPADRKRMVDILKRDGKVQNLELEGLRKSGERFSGLLSVETLELGGKRLMITTVRDITDRKKAETALMESEERFRLFMDHFPGLAYVKDSTGRILFANEGFRTIVGIAPEEIIGKTNAEAFPSEFAEKITMDDMEVLRTGENTQVEESLQDRIWSTYKFVLPKVSGAPLLGGFTLDITERKRAEEALASLLQRHNLATQAAQIGIWDWDIRSDTLVWDDRMYALYGLSPNAFGGAYAAWIGGVHPDDRTLCDEAIQKALRGEKEYDTEFRVMWPDGSDHVIRASGQVIRDSTGTPIRMTGVNYDLTDRKRAEEALKESEARYRLLFESNPHPMWVYDLETLAFLTVNDAAVASYGYSREEFLHMTIADIRLQEDIPDLLANVASREVAGGIDYAGAWRHRKKDNSLIVVEIISHLLTFKGRPAELVLATDVTDRRKAEEKIRRLNEELESRVKERTLQLEAANKELEAFAYSVSHDLRTPLRAIDGYSRILLEDYHSSLDDEGRRVCGVVRTETQRMGQLVDDLLTFSRLSRSHAEATPIPMAALVESVLNETFPPESRSHIEFLVETIPDAMGDPNLMRQVWTNLLSNAVKFSSKRPRPKIEIRGKRVGDGIEYSVRDNGAGFDMNYAGKLFGVFQRLHSSREFEGTGVGLAIVQRIVHRHGGRVWAEGEPDRGATFYFTLPAADVQ